MNTAICIAEIPVPCFRHYLRQTGKPTCVESATYRLSPRAFDPYRQSFFRGTVEVGLARTAGTYAYGRGRGWYTQGKRSHRCTDRSYGRGRRSYPWGNRSYRCTDRSYGRGRRSYPWGNR